MQLSLHELLVGAKFISQKIIKAFGNIFVNIFLPFFKVKNMFTKMCMTARAINVFGISKICKN